MKTENKTEFYVSPEAEVMEVTAQQVICQSGGIKDMNRDDNQELDW